MKTVSKLFVIQGPKNKDQLGLQQWTKRWQNQSDELQNRHNDEKIQPEREITKEQGGGAEHWLTRWLE